MSIRTRSTVLALLVFAMMPPLCVVAGGADESASADRGEYVAESGQIVQPDEIHVHSYVARTDFGYPDPVGPIGVTLQASQQRVSTAGQELLIQIGIQGRRGDFQSIPPINLALLVDASGSMSAPDRIEYARESVRTVMTRLRAEDTISIVAFSETARVILPATSVARLDPEEVDELMAGVLPVGVGNLEAGYQEAVSQIRGNYDRDWVNRVVLISDGLVEAGESIELAGQFFDEGIGTTTVGVGAEFNLELMVDIARAGGGSSRFLTDLNKINEVFYTDFDRAIYAVAYRLAMELTFQEPVEIVGHWGYNGISHENGISFSHPSVHFRDYETIMVRVRTDRAVAGTRSLATFETEYQDASGRTHSTPRQTLDVTYSENVVPAEYPSDRRVLLGGTILDVALGLKDIGVLFYSMGPEQQRTAAFGSANWQLQHSAAGAAFASVVTRESSELSQSGRHKLRRCLDITLALRRQVENVHLRLDTDIFESELKILNAYTNTLNSQLYLSQQVLEALKDDPHIGLTTQAGDLERVISALSSEVFADAGSAAGASFAGFVAQGDKVDRLVTRINQVFSASLPSGVTRVSASDLQDALEANLAGPTDLFDTAIAIGVGQSLGTESLVTGNVVALPDAVVVFVRLIDIEGGEVVSAAQTVLDMSSELQSLIGDRTD